MVVVLLMGWTIFISLFPDSAGPEVPSSMIPPAVVAPLVQSNMPLRVFPGVGGVLMILPDGSLWQWGKTGPGSWPRAKVPAQVGTNHNWMQALQPTTTTSRSARMEPCGNGAGEELPKLVLLSDPARIQSKWIQGMIGSGLRPETCIQWRSKMMERYGPGAITGNFSLVMAPGQTKPTWSRSERTAIG